MKPGSDIEFGEGEWSAAVASERVLYRDDSEGDWCEGRVS
jgi:hypothetical protein